jgi:hypothetical protein
MGGNLAITVREQDGTEHRMDRWTNSMPWFIDNIDLVEKKPQHIADYLKTWYDFRKDWEKHGEAYLEAHKKGGWEEARKVPFEHNMTPVYAQHTFLAPSEYGLVVVDMVNDKILHAQGYTDFGSISRVSAQIHLGQEGEGEFWERHPEHGAAPHCRLREFFEAGRILETFGYVNSEGMTQIKDLADSQALLEYLKGDDPNRQARFEFNQREDVRDLGWEEREAHPECPPIWPDEFANFRLDMSPFEVVRFKEGEEGFRQLKQAIVDLGFVLSEEEEKLWDEFFEFRYGEE